MKPFITRIIKKKLDIEREWIIGTLELKINFKYNKMKLPNLLRPILGSMFAVKRTISNIKLSGKTLSVAGHNSLNDMCCIGSEWRNLPEID